MNNRKKRGPMSIAHNNNNNNNKKNVKVVTKKKNISSASSTWYDATVCKYKCKYFLLFLFCCSFFVIGKTFLRSNNEENEINEIKKYAGEELFEGQRIMEQNRIKIGRLENSI